MKNPWIVLGILAVVLIGGSFFYSSYVASSSNEGVEVTKHLKGNAEAAVVIEEFSDFQCPACQAFQPVLSQVLEDFGDQVVLHYRHFPLPFHNVAEPAARAAEAAGQQGQFFAFHDKLFENQRTWSTSPNPMLQFIKYAEELGLDISLFKQHMRSSVLRDQVRNDMREGRERGVNGTPTFFLNGQRMTFSTYEEFYNAIAAAINPAVSFDLQ
jgi:protein-disulfide isomerase